MAEAMPPEAVVTLLRQFHERMTAQIFACGGTVEKYIGDEIFAVFGVPTASDNDAANALICADMMLEALDHWNVERTVQGSPARDRYRPQLRAGRPRRCRQRAQHVVHGDRRYRQHGEPIAGMLTRTLETPLVVGDPLVKAVTTSSSELAAGLLDRLQDQGEQHLRGRTGAVRVWTLKAGL